MVVYTVVINVEIAKIKKKSVILISFYRLALAGARPSFESVWFIKAFCRLSCLVPSLSFQRLDYQISLAVQSSYSGRLCAVRLAFTPLFSSSFPFTL